VKEGKTFPWPPVGVAWRGEASSADLAVRSFGVTHGCGTWSTAHPTRLLSRPSSPLISTFTLDGLFVVTLRRPKSTVPPLRDASTMPQLFGLGGALFGRKHRLQCLELSMTPEACSELMQHYIDPILLDKIDFTCSHPPMPRYLTYVADHKRQYGERFPASIHTPLHPLESLCQQPGVDAGPRHPPPPPATSRDTVKYEIRLDSFLSYGSLWDAYAATLVGPSTSSRKLVVKVTAPIHYPRSERDKCSDIRFTSAEARQAALHEAAMYEGPLEPLQGTHVPRFCGLWSGRYPRGDPEAGQEIMVMLLENAGMPILDLAADPDVGLWDLSMEQG
jgi:hypothetical protein